MTFLSETISIVPVDIAAHNAVWLARRTPVPLRGEWQLELGSEDQGEAYRGIPNAHHLLGNCVIATVGPKPTDKAAPSAAPKEGKLHVLFSILYGHSYGLVAAVNNYNRWPELMVAILRRILMVPCWHYFDDMGIMQLHFEENTGQLAVQELMELMGRPAKRSKSIALGTMTTHLGCVFKMSSMHKGYITILPKEGRLEKIASKVAASLQKNNISSSDASSLYGDLNFLLTTSYNKVGCQNLIVYDLFLSFFCFKTTTKS
mgnify:CR=1 FL=1